MEIPVVFVVVVRDNGAQLDDEDLDLVDEFQHTLRDDQHTAVFAHGRPAHDGVADDAGQVAQGNAVGRKIGGTGGGRGLNAVLVHEIRQVLADQGQVGMRLKRHFQGQVTGRAPHDLADVPVFAVRAAVVAQVGDILGKGARGGMKPERNSAQHLAVGVPHLHVAVDGLGHPDDLDAVVDHFLGQKGGIGVGVVPAHHYQGVQPQVLTGLA